MASQVQQNWDYARKIGSKLRSLIKDGTPTFEECDHLMSQMRIACESVIFLDFEFASNAAVESVLWDSHVIINARYRKLVDAFRKGDQKKHVVERRKLEKRYADFIKTSQYFYKGFVQRLASHFEGMTGLYRIAHRLSLSVISVDDRVQVSEKVRRMIESSCHATLLRLGDLSRYRNQLRTKDRSWDAALGYYALANDLYPDSGSAHNQMSVISLQEGNHLDGVYHIFRALAVKEPHALAKGNLELEFKKIIFNWEKPSRKPLERPDSLSALVSWFNLLHAKFYEGVEFSTQDELENEVLSRLALLLKEQTFGEVLEKFVIINIAAEEFATEKVRQHDPPKEKDFQYFLFTLAFNVRFMFVLLQILQPELEDIQVGEDIPNGQVTQPKERITATCRRVLPALRQYSIWLVTRAKLLVATIPGPITIHIKELWKMYADVLTRLVSFFPIEQLKPSAYLFEEDTATIGFRPFRDPEIPRDCNFYLNNEGLQKPRITDRGVERNHPNVEMQARVLDIILVGLTLQTKDEYPITLSGETGTPTFVYVEEGLSMAGTYPSQSVSQAPYSTQGVSQIEPSRPSQPAQDLSMPPPQRTTSTVQNEPVEVAESHYSYESEMQRMVESLVDGASAKDLPSNETSYGMHSQTANEVFAPLASSGVTQPVRQSTPKYLPSLSGIWSSPFAPRPNEFPFQSPKGQNLSSAYATNDQRMAAAQELDRITGHGTYRQSSSQPRAQNSRLSPTSNDRHFMPSMQSDFTESSSLYAGTHGDFANERGTGWYGNAFNNTTYYPGATDFDRNTMLQSSIWTGSQPLKGDYTQTPPAGQGG